ncbi:hypothetical protein SLS53_009079 [Cytospora paraplurivora]|uniref:C2 domain-containing protein n=1 Tax=Cytospora paraplurivora TaxID=2898453 RepID=A0AAN9YBF9_9PEZI
MAGLVDKLTASGGTESAGFLNDMIEQLWPNINVVGCRMVKEIVEPMFASMLPGPLASLQFVKLDLGNIPIRVSAVDVTKVDNGGMKLDMDVIWEGDSDIELDGKMVPKLIGAAQVAFINPPELKLDFTDAAEIADWAVVDKAVRKVILDIIASMAVLPNRYLVKLDGNNDYFKTYLPFVGALRLTVERAIDIGGPKKSRASGLLAKIIKDVPDCYCKVNIGAEAEWRTSTKDNDNNPTWNETHDFLVADYDQRILIKIQDDDVGEDDDMGVATTTVKDILLSDGSQELNLNKNGEPSDAKVFLNARFYNFVDDAGVITTTQSENKDQIVGLATVLIASAFGLEGERDKLNPSIKVTWGAKEFRTAAISYSPGIDIFNPSFDQAFRIPVTADLLGHPANFRIALLNKADETGFVEIPFQQILESPGLVREERFDVGSGVTVRASISLRGLQATK